MKVVTAAQMQEIDRRAINEFDIPGETLMENAGFKVGQFVLNFIKKNCLNKKILIFAGKGNNGGDAFVAARYLIQQGYQTHIIVSSVKEGITKDAKKNMLKLEALKPPISFISSRTQIHHLLEDEQFSVIIDGLLGTGAKGEVKGYLKDIILEINSSSLPVISIDIPSGLDADLGISLGATVKASVTITMGLAKEGLIKNEGLNYSGKIKIAEIGFPQELLNEAKSRLNIITNKKILNLLPKRNPISHKGDYGKIFVLAGSNGFTGAAKLCCKSILRSGGGLTTLGIPESLNQILETKTTETITLPLKETPQKSLSYNNLKTIMEKIASSDILVIGPGISIVDETQKLIREIITKTTIPTIIDADGLTAFKNHQHLLKKIKPLLIITPHPGEMATLINKKTSTVMKNRISCAKNFSTEHNLITVLKGAGTIISSAKGELFLNLNGNPGMATAGSGDVLTGIIAGFLGRKIEPLQAAQAGVFIHGLAGDLALQETGEDSLIASDILKFIPQAIKKIKPTYDIPFQIEI